MNLIEVGKSQDRPTPDWLEDQLWPQYMLCNLRAAITSNGQRNHPPNPTVVCVDLAAKDWAQCISVPDVMCAYSWCFVLQNITPE